MACSSQAKIESMCKDKVKGIKKSSLKGIFIVSDGPAIQANIFCEWATSRVCMFPLCLCGFALGTLFPPTLQNVLTGQLAMKLPQVCMRLGNVIARSTMDMA